MTSKHSEILESQKQSPEKYIAGSVKNNPISGDISASAFTEGRQNRFISATTSSSVNLEKYGPLSPSEFQSLKLESLATMEEMQAVSESLSSLLKKEMKLSKQYSEIVPSHSQDSEDGTSLDSEEELDAEQFFGTQSQFFENMKQFLTSQNISLQQNLELLVLRMNRMTAQRQTDAEPIKLSDNSAAIGAQHQELEALRQWGSPTSKNRNEIQICPVCGVEFENNENSDLLDEHVAGHWCSPGSGSV